MLNSVGTQYETMALFGCAKLASPPQRQEESDSDDDGGTMDEGVVRDFHFGGGFVRKEGAGGTANAPDGEDGGQERRRTKKEVQLLVLGSVRKA